MYRLRILAVLGLLLLPVLVIEGRLVQLQVLEGAHYREESERKVTSIEILPSTRGRILDRNGEVLARDRRSFEVQIVPQRLRPTSATPASVVAQLHLRSERLDQSPDLLERPVSMARLAQLFRVRRDAIEDVLTDKQKEHTLAALGRLLGVSTRAWSDRIDALETRIGRLIDGKSRKDQGRLARIERENPIRLVSEVTFDQAAEIETRMDVYCGLQVVERLKREYPAGRAGAHLVGYVGKMNDDEYAERESAGYFRDELVPVIGEEEYVLRERLGHFKADVVGKAGVEAWFDPKDGHGDVVLRGHRGAMIQQRDLQSRTREIIEHAPPSAGHDVRLTIDLRLQRDVEEILTGLRGSAVVIDVRSGELLALASSPGFDPNDFIPPVSTEVVEGVMNHKDHPLLNRTIMSAYPLGSIFKVVTASAGLEEGKIDRTTEFVCEGQFRPEPPHFKCWIAAHGGGHGAQTLVQGLSHSCNVFFCNVGQRVGGEALCAWSARYGLGRRSGIELPGEVAGRLPGRPSAAGGRVKSLTPYEVLNLSIGQGQLEVTPLQAALIMTAVADGGLLLQPKLRLDDARPRERECIPIAPGSLALIREGLAAVVMEVGGTAAKTNLRDFRAAGKTSSAEVTSSEVLRRDPAHWPHAWFAGYAPMDEPRFAFVVMIEHGGKGSEAAAPRAAEILGRAFKYFSP